MEYAVIAIINTLDDSRAVKSAGVAWLPAACWVKGGTIEYDSGPATDAFSNIDDTRVKLDEMRIRVLESFGGHILQ